ncbi:hypothetical protein CPB83DRAFT_740615, partial [Crepidotus variabilis]
MAGGNHWSDAEIEALVHCLYINRSEVSNGANFKTKTYQKCVDYIPTKVPNARQDVKSCRNKWTDVSFLNAKTVDKLMNVSGWVWTDEHGCGITDENNSSWEEYVKRHKGPSITRFRNKGFLPRVRMSEMMPSIGTGQNV